jgi:hypothetical protein
MLNSNILNNSTFLREHIINEEAEEINLQLVILNFPEDLDDLIDSIIFEGMNVEKIKNLIEIFSNEKWDVSTECKCDWFIETLKKLNDYLDSIYLACFFDTIAQQKSFYFDNEQVIYDLIDLKRTDEALIYASSRLRKEKKIVLKAIKQNPNVLKYVDLNLKKDEEVLLAALKKDRLSDC